MNTAEEAETERVRRTAHALVDLVSAMESDHLGSWALALRQTRQALNHIPSDEEDSLTLLTAASYLLDILLTNVEHFGEVDRDAVLHDLREAADNFWRP